MAKYVDGFVLVVPKKNLKAYQKMANKGGDIWKKYGALEYFGCVGDDLNPTITGFKVLGFPKIIKAKTNEAVVFSFIVFKSRKHRDQVNAKVMGDLSINDPTNQNQPMPFDMKKMA